MLKIVVADNPWRLAAAAKRREIKGVQFVELDGLPEGRAYVIDLEAAARMLEDALERFDWKATP